MKALNYLRDALKDYENQAWQQFIPSFKNVLDSAKRGQKFILPNLGRIIDNELAGIPEIVKLPYRTVVLEYTAIGDSGGKSYVERLSGDDTVLSTKRIAIAEQAENAILIHVINFSDTFKKWVFLPYRAIVSTDKKSDSELEAVKQYIDPRLRAQENDKVTGFVVAFQPLDGAENIVDDWKLSAAADMNDEIRAVLELIQALGCRNISAKSIGITPHPPAKNKKKAYPYDEYHILTVDVSNSGTSESGASTVGDRRSPREHLRMGHIRRYKSGICVWIQPTIINAGVGGKITKTYSVK